MTPERVYAVLMEANPVPNPDEFLERLEGGRDQLHLVDSRSEDMQTKEPLRTTEQRPSTAAVRRWGIVAAAMAILAATAIAMLVTGSDPAEVIDEPTSESQRALDAVEMFVAALERGDIDGVEAVMEPDGELSAADREMWGFNAELLAAGYGFRTGTCTADAPEGANLVSVRCDVSHTSPINQVLGVEDMVMPFEYFSDTGRLGWRPFEGADFSVVNRATVEYLRAIEPSAYESGCDPSKFSFGDVNFDQGLALTVDCGRVLVPLVGDIADWIEEGRPLP